MTEQSKKPALNERGASMVEYSLMVALIAVGLICGVSVLQVNVADSFSKTADHIKNGGGRYPTEVGNCSVGEIC